MPVSAGPPRSAKAGAGVASLGKGREGAGEELTFHCAAPFPEWTLRLSVAGGTRAARAVWRTWKCAVGACLREGWGWGTNGQEALMSPLREASGRCPLEGPRRGGCCSAAAGGEQVVTAVLSGAGWGAGVICSHGRS